MNETLPEGATVRVEDFGPVERAYAEAMHEDCPDPPAGHPLADHSPWSGGDLDGTEPWPSFMARLARHGLTLALASEAAPASGEEPPEWIDLAADIRAVDGNHDLGTGSLAAALTARGWTRRLASTAAPPEPGLDAAWAAAEEAAQTWAGGRMEGVEYLPLRDESERWSARLWTNLGGWIGFGPTADAALRDVAWKCSGQGTRQPFDDATERAALSASPIPEAPEGTPNE